MSTPLRLDPGARLVKRNMPQDLFAMRARDRMIRAAFLQITGALRARPEGARVTFENAARADNPSTPWRIDQGAIRAVAQAAAQGSPIEIAETRSRIRAYFAAREADALSFLPPESDESLVACVMAATLAENATEVAEVEVLTKPTCRERLATFASRAREEIAKLTVAARRAEHDALHTQPAGARLWTK